MSHSQFAVFHFDIQTMSMRDAEGNCLSSENDSPPIFNTLEDARLYSQAKTGATPALGCRIYDHNGRAIESFSNPEIYDRHHGLPAAKRNLALGALCLLTGAAGVALDAYLNWRLIFGVLLGIRFVWAGTVKMIDGFTAWNAQKSRG